MQPTATQVSVTDCPLTQKRLGPLDASRHEIGVGRLAIGGPELAREVRRRHECGTRHGRDIEGLRVVAVDEVARPAQVLEVGDLLRRHADDGTPPADHSVKHRGRGRPDGPSARSSIVDIVGTNGDPHQAPERRGLPRAAGTRWYGSSHDREKRAGETLGDRREARSTPSIHRPWWLRPPEWPKVEGFGADGGVSSCLPGIGAVLAVMAASRIGGSDRRDRHRLRGRCGVAVGRNGLFGEPGNRGGGRRTGQHGA